MSRSSISLALRALAVSLLLVLGAVPAHAAQAAVSLRLVASPVSVLSGANVVLTATATSTGGTPTGTVRWHYSTNGGSSYTPWAGRDTALASGAATRTWVSNTPTAWRWRAQYLGDATHAPAWSAAVIVTVGSPERAIAYAAGSTARWFRGLAFDTCTAPSVAQMAAWKGSPYDAVAIYLSGGNRGCRQPNLTAEWVRAVTAQGWRILPVHFGAQPSCTRSAKPLHYSSSTAHAVGVAEAGQAVAAARALGLGSGSIVYTDVEPYDTSDAACRAAILRNVSAWTSTMHANGYLAGAYMHRTGLPDLSAAAMSRTYAGPDAVWMARWDSVASTTGWAELPADRWALHQRAKQYRGDHRETWGGVTLNIDSDVVDAPVATTRTTYSVVGASTVNARSGPWLSSSIVRRLNRGATVSVVCQAPGSTVGTTAVWNLLSDGSWVTDYYVSTRSQTTYTAALPRCAWPGTVTASGVTARTGPGTSYRASGTPLPFESLAWVRCQRAGSKVGTSSVWDRLDDGRWVADYYVRNKSNTTWSSPVPRC